MMGTGRLPGKLRNVIEIENCNGNGSGEKNNVAVK